MPSYISGINNFNTNNVITDTGHSFVASSGYQKLSNGLILQWGEYQNNNNVTVVFPTAFPNACLSVVNTMHQSTASSGPNYSTSVKSFNKTRVIFNGLSSWGTVLWFAIGY